MNRRIFFASLFLVCFLTGCASTKTASNNNKSPQELLEEGDIIAAESKFIYAADINGKDARGNTVLHVVCKMENDDPGLIDFFLSKGADPEIKNDSGDTPLHVAIRNENYKCADAIIKAAAQRKISGDTLYSKDAKGIAAVDLALNADKSICYKLNNKRELTC